MVLTVFVVWKQLHLIRGSTAAPYQTRVKCNCLSFAVVLQQFIHFTTEHSTNQAVFIYSKFETATNAITQTHSHTHTVTSVSSTTGGFWLSHLVK